MTAPPTNERPELPMHLALERPLVSIDLETTGVDVKEDRIVQIAVVRLEPDGTRTTKARIINPGRPIPKEATDVHGIGNDDVDGHPHFQLIAKSLAKLLAGADVTGYNVRAFDVPLLAAEFERCGITWPEDGILVVDAYEIYRRQEPQKLAQALEFYTGEILGADAHDAEADAKAALSVLMGQSLRYIGDERCTLRDMQLLAKDPDWVDQTGKVKWQGDTAVINFGKWQGKPLQAVDPSYWDWVLRQDFPDDFMAICQAAKSGQFPTRQSDG